MHKLARGAAAGLCLVAAQVLMAQSDAQLDTLIFDAVYDPHESPLTSSAGRYATDGTVLPAISQPGPRASLSEILSGIDAYKENINRLIEDGGTFDPRLAQEYLALGDLYLQAGEFENAITTFETTMHIHRVNQGLFTLEQAAAVRKLIDSNKVARKFGEADKYHQYLYVLMQENFEQGSPEFVAATLEWADWNMEAFRRMAFQQEEGLMVSGDVTSVPASMLRRRELVAIEDNQFSEILFVPRAVLLSNPSNVRIQSYTPDQLMDPRLKKAEELYDILLESDDRNREVLTKKANITHLFKTQLEQFIGNDMIGSSLTANSNRSARSISVLRRGYSDSRDNLEELASSLEDEDPVAAARAWIDLADWDLAFDRYARATDGYGKAREILLANGYSEEAVTAFITPEPAILIPAFATFEGTRAFQNIPETEDLPYAGYIDVTFDKQRDGDLVSIEIYNISEDTSQRIRGKLLDMLRNVKARPLVVAGDPVTRGDINVRYYYSY